MPAGRPPLLALPMPQAPRRPTRAAVPTRMRWWYAAIADYMLQHPSATREEIARVVGHHKNWVGLIMASSFFRAYYAERRREYERELDAGIATRIRSVAEKSLDRLIEKLDDAKDKPNATTIGGLADLASKSLEALGYGGRASAGPSVSVSVQQNAVTVTAPVAPEVLAAARERLQRSETAGAAERLNRLAQPEEVVAAGDLPPLPGELELEAEEIVPDV